MKYFNIKTYKEYAIFYWLLFVGIISIFLSSVYSDSKIEQSNRIKTSLNNIYLKKTLIEVTNNLNPRYSSTFYTSKPGDTYQSIINKLDIQKEDKNILLESILKEKSLKVLRINQKFTFKYDHLLNKEIVYLKLKLTKKMKFFLQKTILQISSIKKD